MLDSGTILQGRYAVMGTIGQGGMGTVYLAHLLSLQNKRVAIKEVRAKFGSEEERERAMKRFKQEADLLATLDHPNLVHINDYFTQGDSAFLVCDYVEGTTLGQLIQKADGFLPMVVVHRLFNALCDVLEYCHGRPRPVIFRDLKPDNVMINAEGQLKLIDFGIACIIEPGRTTASFLQGTGTHGYAPIEQYMPNPLMDPGSDIYSLGATLYSMLTRKIPPSAVEIATGHVSLPAPETINRDVPSGYGAFITKMMQTQRAERLNSIAEVRAAMADLGKPTLIKPPEARNTAPTTSGPGKAKMIEPPPKGKAAAAPPPMKAADTRKLKPIQSSKTTSGGAKDELIGAWKKKRHCPRCGTEGRHGTEVCVNCGQPLKRRTVSLFEPLQAGPTQFLVSTPEELARQAEKARPPLDFRDIPGELRPVPPKVKASVHVPQGIIDYLVARDTTHEEVAILELTSKHIRFRGFYDYAPGSTLLLRMALPVVALGDHLLVDTRIQITEVGAMKNNLKTYQADFKGLSSHGAFLLDSLQRQERRQARRFRRTCQIVSKDLARYKALTIDVSASGMGFLSNRSMAVGALIELILDPDVASMPQITVVARVVHGQQMSEEEYRIGVAFVEVSDKNARVLQEFLLSLTE
ncbi:MAG TPA: serine/threonine-protein kinase [Candidatus Xenobia bacterium]